MTGQSQSEVSEILHGRQVLNIRLLERITDGFRVSRKRPLHPRPGLRRPSRRHPRSRQRRPARRSDASPRWAPTTRSSSSNARSSA
ncbi:MAG: hypothetical protein ACRDR6_18480 [Pseudonocardiaceae bacterium]